MDFNYLYDTLVGSLIDVIIAVLQEYFGAVFDLVDAILMLTA
jgi:hypothetical protein